MAVAKANTAGEGAAELPEQDILGDWELDAAGVEAILVAAAVRPDEESDAPWDDLDVLYIPEEEGPFEPSPEDLETLAQLDEAIAEAEVKAKARGRFDSLRAALAETERELLAAQSVLEALKYDPVWQAGVRFVSFATKKRTKGEDGVQFLTTGGPRLLRVIKEPDGTRTFVYNPRFRAMFVDEDSVAHASTRRFGDSCASSHLTIQADVVATEIFYDIDDEKSVGESLLEHARHNWTVYTTNRARERAARKTMRQVAAEIRRLGHTALLGA